MNKGFTLFELLVSIAVIVIVSSFIMIGRNGEEQKMFLRTTAFTTSQNLREYQEKALSGENINCGVNKNVCGFGINFSQNNDFYTPFIDCASNCSLSGRAKDAGDVSYSPISLGKVKICAVSGGTGNLDAVFAPPDPIVYLNGNVWAGSDSEITLCLKANTGITKKIKLNNAGKIEIQ